MTGVLGSPVLAGRRSGCGGAPMPAPPAGLRGRRRGGAWRRNRRDSQAAERRPAPAAGGQWCKPRSRRPGRPRGRRCGLSPPDPPCPQSAAGASRDDSPKVVVPDTGLPNELARKSLAAERTEDRRDLRHPAACVCVPSRTPHFRFFAIKLAREVPAGCEIARSILHSG